MQKATLLRSIHLNAGAINRGSSSSLHHREQGKSNAFKTLIQMCTSFPQNYADVIQFTGLSNDQRNILLKISSSFIELIDSHYRGELSVGILAFVT